MKLRLLLLLATLWAGTTSFSWRPVPYSGPLEVSYWYWHSPFRISRTDKFALAQMGVKRLFVRAGTFSSQGGVHLTLPQEWASGAEQSVVLVFNAHTDLLRDFGSLPNDVLVAAIRPAIVAQIERAKSAGIRVSGIQLDIDCPTRLLDKYADLLTTIRGAIPLELSITALPTWLTSDAFRNVAGSVDFVVPQFYEGRIARDVREFAPISSSSRLARGLGRLEMLGKPFMAGLPAYGHALAYNGEGKLLGAYHDMDAAEAMSHPALRLIDSSPAAPNGGPASSKSYIGEDLLKFIPTDMRPNSPDDPDHGMGRKPYYLVYDVPTPVMLSRNLQVLRDRRPSNCRGIVLYRFPGAGDPMALPLTASATVLNNRIPSARLSVKVDRMNTAWEAIDTGAHSSDKSPEFSLVVTNIGSAGSAVAPRAVDVTLKLDVARFESVDAGEFDSVEGLRGNLQCSLSRANFIRFRKAFLGAGQKATIGPISLKRDAQTAIVEWSVRQHGGFEATSGRTEIQLR